MTHLNEAGLKPGRDFRLLEVPSFASAILSLQKGDADAAVSAPGALVQMTNEMRDSVRPVVDTGEYVNLIILSHPRLEKKLSGLLGNALLKFGNTTGEGKQFLASTGFGSIIPVTPKDMNNLDRYTPETKRLLDLTH
jgi:ABC-type phosphate/phosphonate transport system substrate-binding protein